MKRHKSFKNQTPILYLVASPIGNLQEISPRAKDTLNLVSAIACEDTRVSYKLLEYLKIKKPLISLHEHNETKASQEVIALLKEGHSVAYLSDAGYPGISDPGAILVQKVLEEDLSISVISGPSAFLNALVASGLSTSSFTFIGFLPSKSQERIKKLESLKNKTETLIFYIAPHKVKEIFLDFEKVFAARKACLARELTKLHEEYIYGTINEFAHLDEETLIGEMVFIVEGKSEEATVSISDDEIKQVLATFLKEGKSTKEAIKLTADLLNISKNYIYALTTKKI